MLVQNASHLDCQVICTQTFKSKISAGSSVFGGRGGGFGAFVYFSLSEILIIYRLL